MALLRNYLTITLLFAFSMLLVSCADEKPSNDPAPTTDSAAPVAPAAAAPATQMPVDTTTPGPREVTPIDPQTGTMTMTASAPEVKTRTLVDVNGSIVEQAGGGETVARLQLEGHDDPYHFKIRLGGGTGEITAGRYVVGDPERGVDATYEANKVFYKSLGAATGTVSLTEITEDRAKGTFDLNLETLSETPEKSRVHGSFDMRVQR